MPSAIEILNQLREIFPHQTLQYLKGAAAFYRNDPASLESFVRNAVESQHFPLFPVVLDNELEAYLRNQFENLKEMLPDAEESYLQTLFEAHAGSSLEAVALDAILYQSYPKKQRPKKVAQFDVKLYVDLVPDAVASYSHKNYIMTAKMKSEGTNYLARIFGEDKRVVIQNLMEKEESLYMAYQKVRKDSGEANAQLCTARITVQPKTFESPDTDQIFEKLFIENEGVILSYLDQKRMNEKEQCKKEEISKKLIECKICNDLKMSLKIVKLCQNGHTACDECVKRHTEQLFYDQGIMYFPCLFDCELFLANNVIRSNWDTHKFSKLLHDRIPKSNGKNCPSCHFVCEGSTTKDIQCNNCLTKFCFNCKKAAHSPQECLKTENDMCKAVEESMTKALVRSCPKCYTPFIKEAACCNRVMCPKCRTYTCYLCQKIVSGNTYSDHFYGQGSQPSPGLCPLNSDINLLHVYHVIDAGKKALEKVTADNPDRELAYDPLAVLPKAGKSDAVPNQF